jgi:hypothetical protein
MVQKFWNFNHNKFFGCVAYTHIPKEKNKIIGYDIHTKGYNYDNAKSEIFVGTNVILCKTPKELIKVVNFFKRTIF